MEPGHHRSYAFYSFFLYAETVEADGEPILRMYQYERVRHLVYRVEASLAGDRLYVRIKIDNARQQDTAVYWWSNIAVDEREDVRVIVPRSAPSAMAMAARLPRCPIPISRLGREPLRADSPVHGFLL